MRADFKAQCTARNPTMKLTGENRINARPAEVWRALNDPDVLRRAIPGCESLEKVSDTEFKATVGTKIGPVQARFSGQVQLSDLDPPNGYTISGSGSAGPAGNARGSARVRLEPDGNGTKLSYDVDAQVAGKLAQIGSRLIDSAAKMLAGQFFNRFEEIVGGPAPAEQVPGAAAPTKGGIQEIPVWAWAVGAAILVLLGVYLFAR
jgi:carbon monoxide dehydrogenase subunit G